MNEEKGKSLKDINFGSEDVEKSFGLHTIFVTASPVLTIEVKRFYEKLNERVINRLKRWKQRQIQKEEIKEEIKEESKED